MRFYKLHDFAKNATLLHLTSKRDLVGMVDDTPVVLSVFLPWPLSRLNG
jgi:hypothetical protein